jgi:hypothetical protein
MFFLIKFSSVFICVHVWFQAPLRASAPPWGGLATRAKMAAPARHDHAADDCLAAKTRLTVALIDSVPQLELAAIALGIDVV